MLKISEIFKSIEGEGSRAGYPAVFVRLYGCNCSCSYCDSTYACTGEEYHSMSVDDVIHAVQEYNIPRITVTGGEPLLQDDCYELIERLLELHYNVNVETNGSVDLKRLYKISYKSGLVVTMDWKSDSSGMSDKMLASNLELLRDCDVLKFVVGDELDLHQMKSIIFGNHMRCYKYVSPVFGEITPRAIVDFLLKENLYQVRLQLQLHKIIWDPDKRGV